MGEKEDMEVLLDDLEDDEMMRTAIHSQHLYYYYFLLYWGININIHTIYNKDKKLQLKKIKYNITLLL